MPTLLYHTGLSPRLIRHGLSVLVQQQLVFWYSSAEDVTIYEANAIVAYNLVRAGKYVQIAEDRIGQFAGALISNLLLLGHARVGDLVQAYGISPKDKNDISTGSSYTTEHSIKSDVTVESLHMNLYDLLRNGLVSPVNESHFRSDVDNRIEAGKIVPAPEYFKAKTKRENEAQREAAIQLQLEEWKYSTAVERGEVGVVQKGKKRRLENLEDPQALKRQRTYLPLSDQLASATATGHPQKLGAASILDVWTSGTSFEC